MESSRWNRRSFLKTSAAAAVGMGIVSTARSQGANDKIRAAVIGLKGRGGSHIDGFLDQKGVDVVALCDVDASVLDSRVKEVEKRTQAKPAALTDMRKLFEDKSIDV